MLLLVLAWNVTTASLVKIALSARPSMKALKVHME